MVAQVQRVIVLVTQLDRDRAKRRAVADWEVSDDRWLFFIPGTWCLIAVELVNSVAGFVVSATPHDSITVDLDYVVVVKPHLELSDVLAEGHEFGTLAIPSDCGRSPRVSERR